MMQNILKYKTVVIALLNIHPHVLGIYILIFFLPSWQGVLSALKAKQFKSVLSLSLRSDAGGLLSALPFFLFSF